jgi:hypothetical protein
LQGLIELGARTVVVPGNFPIGCNPGYLTKFQTNDTAQYDSMGCLRWPNDLAELHNRALRAELAELGRRHSGVAVIYADYYAAAMDLAADPRKHGTLVPRAFFLGFASDQIIIISVAKCSNFNFLRSDRQGSAASRWCRAAAAGGLTTPT